MASTGASETARAGVATRCDPGLSAPNSRTAATRGPSWARTTRRSDLDVRALVQERPVVGRIGPPGLLPVSVESKRPFQVLVDEWRVLVRRRQPEPESRRDVIQDFRLRTRERRPPVDPLGHEPPAVQIWTSALLFKNARL